MFRGDERNISRRVALGDEMEEMEEMYIFLQMKISILSQTIAIKKSSEQKMEKGECQIFVMEKMVKTLYSKYQ